MARYRKLGAALPTVVAHFDDLPDIALVDLEALKLLTGKSRATIYRWIDRGILPKPRKLGPTHNAWTVGEIRRLLQ
ncbi:helix-turn-helix transcriptional regulator [Aromatoleum aromaticum]|uniref:helix-turn-helix transcriptional regulator n=1 Tax=Aromatoleum aromaticum TaxID=551760 RepID=UPI001459BAF5|nr:AlpA family phage regulatory protein [Aromatoleum aromaticum]NMG56114.1 AlpA family phage regulatory protein [Aromatoleum aromaticum]